MYNLNIVVFQYTAFHKLLRWYKSSGFLGYVPHPRLIVYTATNPMIQPPAFSFGPHGKDVKFFVLKLMSK